MKSPVQRKHGRSNAAPADACKTHFRASPPVSPLAGLSKGSRIHLETGTSKFHHADGQDETELLTALNVPLMLTIRLLTMPMAATTISPSMTAYSTAVGPCSLTRNPEIDRKTL